MIPSIIRQQLAVLRQREMLLRFVWGLARLLTVILGLVILFCLIDYVVDRFVETPWPLHLALLLTLLLGSIAAGVYFFWPLGKSLGDEELSLWIEDKTPRLQHRLISAVQFSDEDAQITGMSKELVVMVTKEAEEQVRAVPAANVADHGRLKRCALTLGPAMVVALIPLLLVPSLCGILLGRLFLADWEIPRRVTNVVSATRPVNPRGESLIIKVRADGCLPGDKAKLYFTQGDVSDSLDMEVARETLFLKLDLLTEKTAAFRDRMSATRRDFADTKTKMDQAKNAVDQLEETVRKTDDPDKQRLLYTDLEKRRSAAEILAAKNTQLGDDLKKNLVRDQDALKEALEEHGRELARFLAERPRNDELADAVKKLNQAAEQLDRGNDAATLALAHELAQAAQDSLTKKMPVRLIEGDVLSIRLGMPADDCTWVVVRKDDSLTAEGEPEIRGNEQEPKTCVFRFQTSSPGTVNLELLYEKSDRSRVKTVTFTARVEPREQYEYRAEIKAPTSDSLTFTAEIGDGRMRSLTEIKLEPRPVADVTAYTILPPYCQTNPEGLPYQIPQSRGEVSGIPGSSVRIQANVLRQLKSATVHVYDTEDPKSDDFFKRRERKVQSVPMKLLLQERTIEVMASRFVTMFHAANGDKISNSKLFADGKLSEQGLSDAGFKQNAEVNFVAEAVPNATAAEANSANLMQIRLVDGSSPAKEDIDGPHKGRIVRIDAAKSLLIVERSEGPTIAEGKFPLQTKTTHYSVEVVDVHGFHNDPIPRFGVQEIPEAKPTIKLLREEFPSFKRIYEAMTGKILVGRDDSGLFEGMPIPVGGPIPVAYSFDSPYGVDRAVLKFRILKKTLSGNESNNSNALGLALDDADGGPRIVQVLEGSSAEAANLKINIDQITEAGGVPVSDVQSFMKIANKSSAGDKLSIKVKRAGEPPFSVTLTVGRVSDEKYQSIKLIPYKGDAKGDFDLDRGIFDGSSSSDEVRFYAIPSHDPSRIGLLNGGGRFFLQTAKMAGGVGPQEGDELEFYIEIYPAANPNGPKNDDRPIGESAKRIRPFSDKGLTDRLLASDQEQAMVRGLATQQDGVFPSPEDPKEPREDKEKKAP